MQSERSLSEASQNGELDQVKQSLSHSAHTHQELVKALTLASRHGQTTIVKLFIDRGVTVDSIDDSGQTALILASQYNHFDTVQILLDYQAKINMQDKSGTTALMTASAKGNNDIITLLLEHKAQVNIRNNDGWTALMLASCNSHVKAVKILLKYDAHVDQEFLFELTDSDVLDLLREQLGMYNCMHTRQDSKCGDDTFPTALG